MEFLGLEAISTFSLSHLIYVGIALVLTLILNLSLIHTSLELIEYVVYHELCHFVYKNHQSEFHLLLQQFVPNEKQLKKVLNNYIKFYYKNKMQIF